MKDKSVKKIRLLFPVLAIEFVLFDALFVYFSNGVSFNLFASVLKIAAAIIATLFFAKARKLTNFSAGILLLVVLLEGILNLFMRTIPWVNQGGVNKSFLIVDIAILVVYLICLFLQFRKKGNRFINYLGLLLLVGQTIIGSFMFNMMHPIAYVEVILYYISNIACMLAYRRITK